MHGDLFPAFLIMAYIDPFYTIIREIYIPPLELYTGHTGQTVLSNEYCARTNSTDIKIVPENSLAIIENSSRNWFICLISIYGWSRKSQVTMDSMISERQNIVTFEHFLGIFLKIAYLFAIPHQRKQPVTVQFFLSLPSFKFLLSSNHCKRTSKIVRMF